MLKRSYQDGQLEQTRPDCSNRYRSCHIRQMGVCRQAEAWVESARPLDDAEYVQSQYCSVGTGDY